VAQSQEQLIEQAQQGCIDSFGILYEQYYNGIVALSYSALGEMGLAEDAAQETFAIACRDLMKLRDNSKFGGWLAGICRNVSRQIMRKEQKLVELRDRQNVMNAKQTNEVGEAIKEALRLLRPKYREPIVLRYYDNLSYQQISNILGISQVAVNGRILRAKRKIAKYLIHKGIAGVGYGNSR
jgi:RNA polymerase sigma-70 factor (ECF subfamily)